MLVKHYIAFLSGGGAILIKAQSSSPDSSLASPSLSGVTLFNSTASSTVSGTELESTTSISFSQTDMSLASLTTQASATSVSTSNGNSSSISILSSSSASVTTTVQTTTRNTVPIMPYTFTPYPSPTLTGGVPSDPQAPPKNGLPDFSLAWANAYDKAKTLIYSYTLDQKASVATGASGRCIGNILPVNGSDFPGLCLEDSPLGVRLTDYVTSFPTGINAAATFNRTLIRLRGLFMGREHAGKGVNVALGPMMNMNRVAQAGRNWEGFGADPFLTGEAAYETILGMQEGGVQACAKHLVGNEQEQKRTMESSDIDDRTLHEVYAHPFLRSVMAGVASMMCSYNLLNGTYACEDDRVLNHIVKYEYGFQGYIMSDWGATHSTISAITGLDMTMPSATYFGANLTEYVQNGTIPASRIDDMATRIISAWYFLHQDSPTFPATNFDSNSPDNEATNAHIDVQDDHYRLVRSMGAASTVLLKNIDNTLPLNKPRNIVLVGSDAGPGVIGPNEFRNQAGSNGTLAMGWGSGTATFTYLISPYEAIQRRARDDRTTVSWMFDDLDLARAGSMAHKQSAALVFISADSGEGDQLIEGNAGDRKDLVAWHGGDALVQAVAAQNNNTIVVVHSVGPLILEPWIENPNVTAVLWAGLPGQESGNSIVDILYGDWNPSARLPYTIAKRLEDYPAQLVTGGDTNDILDIPYVEGLNIDYRHFDANNITPRFEFGFGLSYTTFEYSDLGIRKIVGDADSHAAAAWEAGGVTEMGVGSSRAAWLHQPAFRVAFKVQNTGPIRGGDIPQVYLRMLPSSGEPPSVLKGFTDVDLEPGEITSVVIHLSRYDVSIWDTVAQGWRRPEGHIGLVVGTSSRDIRLVGALP